MGRLGYYVVDKPVDAITSLEKCDKNAFPVIYHLLLVFAIQPVTTSNPERTFSNLRRLKTWLRSTMREDRLSGLALMALNRDKLSLEDAPIILDKFVQKKARRLNLLLE